MSNFCEPFFGSGAVLLGRPHPPRVETANDLDCMLANFWRALKFRPGEVAEWCDWPVNECDMHSRHLWLVQHKAEIAERMKRDPLYFDTQIAGWWVWGICQWIGGGWCSNPEWRGRTHAGAGARGVHTVGGRKPPNLGGGSKGVNAQMLTEQKRPALGTLGRELATKGEDFRLAQQMPNLGGSYGNAGHGVHASGRNRLHQRGEPEWQARPVLSSVGMGINAGQVWQQVPDLSGSRGAAGRGIHASGRGKHRYNEDVRPQLTGAGIHAQRLDAPPTLEWMQALARRLRRVRVCCGDWSRVLGPAVTTCIGTTGVFLDPPYSEEAERDPGIYAEEDLRVAHKVREWAIANGDNPKLRIALCGYEGEHQMPACWRCVAWKASGGYGSRNADNKNAARERIWFSPHCLGSKQLEMFSGKAVDGPVEAEEQLTEDSAQF